MPTRAERFTHTHPCPICGGFDGERRGRGRRCYGYLDSTGEYARCTREEFAGALKRNEDGTYSHRLRGRCRCGAVHHPEVPQAAGSNGIGGVAALRSAEAAKGGFFPSLQAVIEHYAQQGLGRHVETYRYRDEAGETLFVVLRFAPKAFRQARAVPGGWTLSLDGCRRVLYRTPELLTAGDEMVFVPEGEKDADRLAGEGLIATTAPGGARKWRPEHVEQLSGRHVCLLADNDADGEASVEQAAELLGPRAGSVRIVRLPALPDGGDVSDWLDAGHTVEDLERLAREVPLWQPRSDGMAADADESAVVPLRPRLQFPLLALPDSIAAFVEEVAAALHVSQGMVATLSLGCLAGAIGASRALEVKPGWLEIPSIWSATISEPGGGKSPALKAASGPLRERENASYCSFKHFEERWKEAVVEWNDAPRRTRGPAPERPTWDRLLVDDITSEALGTLLAEHPRGLLQLLDEMSALVRGFDQYKAKGAGADRSRYLKIWSHEALHIDRKGDQGNPTYVPRPCLSIVGGLQPDVVDELRERRKNDGLIDRILFCFEPHARPRPWSEALISSATRARYNDVFEHLLRLDTEPGLHGLPQPRVLRKSQAGHQLWTRFYDEHEDERAHPDLLPQLRGYFEKSKAYAARMALLVHLIRRVEDRGLGEERRTLGDLGLGARRLLQGASARGLQPSRPLSSRRSRGVVDRVDAAEGNAAGDHTRRMPAQCRGSQDRQRGKRPLPTCPGPGLGDDPAPWRQRTADDHVRPRWRGGDR